MKKQEIVSLSTTESKYVATTYAAKEVLTLIMELFGITLSTTTLFNDNQSAITLTKEHQYHARTKHIDVHYHFIRWIIEEGKIQLIYCLTEEMVADMLTKPFPSESQTFCCLSWARIDLRGSIGNPGHQDSGAHP